MQRRTSAPLRVALGVVALLVAGVMVPTKAAVPSAAPASLAGRVLGNTFSLMTYNVWNYQDSVGHPWDVRKRMIADAVRM